MKPWEQEWETASSGAAPWELEYAEPWEMAYPSVDPSLSIPKQITEERQAEPDPMVRRAEMGVQEPSSANPYAQRAKAMKEEREGKREAMTYEKDLIAPSRRTEELRQQYSQEHPEWSPERVQEEIDARTGRVMLETGAALATLPFGGVGGTVVKEALPFLLSKSPVLARGLAGVVEGGAMAGGTEAAGQLGEILATDDKSRFDPQAIKETTGMGAVLGGALPIAGEALGSAGRAVRDILTDTSKLAPEAQRALQTASEEGITLTPGQVGKLAPLEGMVEEFAPTRAVYSPLKKAKEAQATTALESLLGRTTGAKEAGKSLSTAVRGRAQTLEYTPEELGDVYNKYLSDDFSPKDVKDILYSDDYVEELKNIRMMLNGTEKQYKSYMKQMRPDFDANGVTGWEEFQNNATKVFWDDAFQNSFDASGNFSPTKVKGFITQNKDKIKATVGSENFKKFEDFGNLMNYISPQTSTKISDVLSLGKQLAVGAGGIALDPTLGAVGAGAGLGADIGLTKLGKYMTKHSKDIKQFKQTTNPYVKRGIAEKLVQGLILSNQDENL